MRALLSVLSLSILSGWASAQSSSLDGKVLTIEHPGASRTVPVRIAEGVDGTKYFASEGGGSMVITVVDGVAWGVLQPRAAGTLRYSVQAMQSAEPAVKLVKREGEEAVDVTVLGVRLTTYHYSNENRKPYLWPVKAEGDASVTRDWPMGDGGASKDHPHQVSFWTGYGDINGHDYWEYGGRTGWQRTESIEFGSGDACGWITTHIVWEDKDRKPVIDEYRTFRFYTSNPVSGARLFDVDVRFVASYGAVKFGDTKEGGIVSVRVADALRERGGSGTVTTSEGVTGGTAAWGKPAAWCDYSGTIEGAGVRGIAVFDHPSSFRHPTHWHVRDYGLMGANPFGYSHFYNGAKNGDHTVEANETLSFSYRIYVHSGDATQAQVAEYYNDFANPPKVRIE
jgi:hypothetical protein